MYKRRKTYIRFACYSIKLFFFFVSIFLSSRIIYKETKEPYVQTIVGDVRAHFVQFSSSFSLFLFVLSRFCEKRKIANSLYKTRLVVSEIRKHTREEGHIVLIQSFIKRKTKKKKKNEEKKQKKKKKTNRYPIV